MNSGHAVTIDGNEAAASVAYRTSEVIAIYPITPASTMGELADDWSAHGRSNIWGGTPDVIEMQSEGGAAGAVHGALQAGALTTTFTASQGLLLMIPNMYKVAGELTPFCMHVAARTLATHALSIFGDHSDVMACRQTGFAMLASASPQEAQDMACIATMATLRSRIPFLHFFDGFRTSHQIDTLTTLSDDDLRALIDHEAIDAHRARALTPDNPVLRGTAQNPDVFFQAREAINPYYEACTREVIDAMDAFGARTGRHYSPFEYIGDPNAERVIVIMGSGAETVQATVEWLAERNERVGVLRVRLFRPFSCELMLAALPDTVKTIAVMDRTKEPGSAGEPLYQDIVTALWERSQNPDRAAQEQGKRSRVEPMVIGGRYGLSSKEFTPAMVAAVYKELAAERPRTRFTVGIVDDVTHLSLTVDAEFEIEEPEVMRTVVYGLGSDGTVGANKSSIKLIGEETDNYAQGYFVYDSKKAGAVTISHLRFGPNPFRAPYLIRKASFVACHQYSFLEQFDVLELAEPGAVFLLNAPYDPDAVWDRLPREVQDTIVEKRLRFYVIDAYALAREAGVGPRINTIMQTCFFEISGILGAVDPVARIKKSVEANYGKKGPEILRRNFAAIEQTLPRLHEVTVPTAATATHYRPPIVAPEAPDFVQRVTAVILANRGDYLPVSAFPVDGTWPLGTSKWEKRNLAAEIPVWDTAICIQCNKCVLVCPHAAIRAKVYPDAEQSAPATFKSTPYRGRELPDHTYSLQVAPEDCTGCSLCVEVCPAKDKANPRHKAIDMVSQPQLRESERDNYDYFLSIPEIDRTTMRIDLKSSQFLEPLFEYSGACAGCGETPYLKLLTQLFGDRALIANATGCSSIYGGNLPTTPYTVNTEGRGPAWSNSLFEDNAEFGLGMRLAVDYQRELARAAVSTLATQLGEPLVTETLTADMTHEAGIARQRERVSAIRKKLNGLTAGTGLSTEETAAVGVLRTCADQLVKKSVWLVGGDGWAYDIGFGGLDHVLSTGRDVNILVLDTEVYSNTGGQQSKATPMAASAKFAVAGKESSKKDLGLIAMSYGNAYVARVAFGAKDQQTVRAFQEAEAYPGPSLIIAYSHCIAHGYDLAQGARQQKLAVDSGVWPLYRFDPLRRENGDPPLHLDCPPPKIRATEYMRGEARFRIAEKVDPKRFKRLIATASQQATERYALYQQLAGITVNHADNHADKHTGDASPTEKAHAPTSTSKKD
ncbi:MAG: pyruvate-ferredoxin/flavodoxin oxidoreductase [Hyphomicrobiaceae bacterium]|jgi:pyruvate-ferredoxin/flavodoxin oxidoreductase